MLSIYSSIQKNIFRLFSGTVKALVLLIISLSIICCSSSMEQIKIESVGISAGFYGSKGYYDFHQEELFTNLTLPQVFDLGNKWIIRSRLDLTLGRLSGLGDHGFVSTIGPKMILERKEFPVAFAIGSSPTIITREKFRDKDFGFPFQFTSSAGFIFRVSEKFELTYRFQHMSNASLSSNNPGLNLHMFSLGYRF